MKAINISYDHQGYPWSYTRDYKNEVTILSSHDMIYTHHHEENFVNVYKIQGSDLIRYGNTSRQELAFMLKQLHRYANMISRLRQ